jgi:hypothetical protein
VNPWQFSLKEHVAVRTHPHWRSETVSLFLAEVQWGETGATWQGGNGDTAQRALFSLAFALAWRFSN